MIHLTQKRTASHAYTNVLLTFYYLPFISAQTNFSQSAESSVFSTDTRPPAVSVSANSQLIVLDTRAMESERVSAETLPSAFIVDTRVGAPSSLTVDGLASTNTGEVLGGVSIEIKIYGQVWWRGVSGPDGTFQPPEMKAQNYSVIASKIGYVTYGRNIEGVAGGLRNLLVTMIPLPEAPRTQIVSRLVAEAEKSDEADPFINSDPGKAEPQLKLYGSGRWHPVGKPGSPTVNPDAMSVVLAHGWLSSVEDWPLRMALLISNNHSSNIDLNIFAWDWETAADSVAPWPDRATKQGIALGQALRRRLGYEYARHVHFIGHSMGTIVNRFACDTVHQAGTLNAGEFAWNPYLTLPHLTLLDEAELTSFLGTRVLTSATIGAITSGWAGALREAAVTAYQDWKSPIPATPASLIDSYISMVGIQRPQAVNICLTAPAVGFLNPIDAHAYAHQWYADSARPPFSPVLGFRQSREGGGTLPSSLSGLDNGALWYENLGTPEPLDLVRDPNPTKLEANLSILGTYSIHSAASIGSGKAFLAVGDYVGNKVLDGYEASLNWVGDQGGTVIVKTQQAYTTVAEKIGNGWDAATDKTGEILNTLNPDRLFDGLSRGVFQIKIGGVDGRSPSIRSGTDTFTEPAAWITLQIPERAGFMQFDFKVTGPPQDDCVAAAVAGKNVFNLPARVLAQGEVQSTDLIDISAYAGKTVEFYFGLTGRTSTSCELVVDGLRFVTIPDPTLVLENHGPTVSLYWPAAASGWRLEASETMAQGSWFNVEAISPDAFTVTNGVNRLEKLRNSAKQFYRLRRSE